MKITLSIFFLIFLSLNLNAQINNTNKTVWDYIGIWQNGEGSSSLNISTHFTVDEAVHHIKVQYNSWTDNFHDHLIVNCTFSNGVIIGDHYGHKENVKIELKEGSLFLTIDPFHEFTPIKKQHFKKAPQHIFKYNVSKNNKTLLEKPNSTSLIADSIIPGDRILVERSFDNPTFYKTKYYASRFTKKSIENQDSYISKKQLHNTKPIFFSENTQLKGYDNLNKSELFIKRLFSPHQLKENTVENLLSEDQQNVAGQKKLNLDEAMFLKLELYKTGTIYSADEYTHWYITGTVDISKDHYSIVIDKQYSDDYNTLLVNYDKTGKFVDYIIIGQGDYVESYNYTDAQFSNSGIFVNTYLTLDGLSYSTTETKRYTVDKNGRFLELNYGNNTINNIDILVKLISQEFESANFGNAKISLFMGYSDTNNELGYPTLLSTIIENKEGIDLTIPVDLSLVAGYYSPPYGDFTGPNGELQKIFNSNVKSGLDERITLKFKLADINQDGLDDLFIELTDKNYVIEPKSYICFIRESDSWVYSQHNEEANRFLEDVTMPIETVFEEFYTTGKPPLSIALAKNKKEGYLLKQNENLIYTFKIKDSDKRVSLGTDIDNKYLVYRFGTEDNVEFEYISEIKSEVNKFSYFKEDQTSIPPRNYLEHISFEYTDNQYALFNNYIESDLNLTPQIPTKDGVGIMVRNIKSGKISFLEADTSSIEGHIGLMKYWID